MSTSSTDGTGLLRLTVKTHELNLEVHHIHAVLIINLPINIHRSLREYVMHGTRLNKQKLQRSIQIFEMKSARAQKPILNYFEL